ncbi:hypothetical protein NDU88_005424 [Pleurodeles waltl]|uniref:Uncharacterized protein n=1 Tax=Pleurodeles waltl TaxID=8319 RepID=A0AAV7LS38_PLEWA|nr:hypothetical protein NDU88_005424 [Pleurodeles waltl]
MRICAADGRACLSLPIAAEAVSAVVKSTLVPHFTEQPIRVHVAGSQFLQNHPLRATALRQRSPIWVYLHPQGVRPARVSFPSPASETPTFSPVVQSAKSDREALQAWTRSLVSFPSGGGTLPFVSGLPAVFPPYLQVSIGHPDPSSASLQGPSEPDGTEGEGRKKPNLLRRLSPPHGGGRHTFSHPSRATWCLPSITAAGGEGEGKPPIRTARLPRRRLQPGRGPGLNTASVFFQVRLGDALCCLPICLACPSWLGVPQLSQPPEATTPLGSTPLQPPAAALTVQEAPSRRHPHPTLARASVGVFILLWITAICIAAWSNRQKPHDHASPPAILGVGHSELFSHFVEPRSPGHGSDTPGTYSSPPKSYSAAGTGG